MDTPLEELLALGRLCRAVQATAEIGYHDGPIDQGTLRSPLRSALDNGTQPLVPLSGRWAAPHGTGKGFL
jgi:hypothetical protein